MRPTKRLTAFHASFPEERLWAERRSGQAKSSLPEAALEARLRRDSDPMIRPRYSYLLGGLLPDARVKIYPDSAHGFLFQHHGEFAADVNAFLEAA
jgi:pimeloyl-ACP methyl ester carboxylesterase